MSQYVVASFYTAVSGLGDIGCSTRNFEAEAPSMETLPLLTFQIISAPFEQTFDRSSLKDYLFQVDIYGRKQSGMSAIGNINRRLVAGLNGATPAITGHGTAKIDCVNEGTRSVEGEYLRVTSEFRLRTGTIV